jgi:hypothetical protein
MSGPSNNVFETNVDPALAAGAEGIFNYTVDENGIGKYEWRLNLNNFVIPESAASLGCTNDSLAAGLIGKSLSQCFVC